MGIFFGLNHIYRIPYEKGSHMEEDVKSFNSLYKEPKNTWDGVILGTSITDRAWVAPNAWAEYGMTIFPLCTDSQPIILSASILDEVRKRQDIKLVVLELHGILSMNPQTVRVRRVTDNLHSDLARIQAVHTAYRFARDNYGENAGISSSDLWDLLFPFIKYHSRTDLKIEDFTSPVNEVKGAFVAEKLAFRSKPRSYPKVSKDCGTLNQIQLDFLDDFMEYCDTHDLEVLFLSIPSGHNRKNQETVNAALDYAAKRGYPTLNMNTSEVYTEINLDFSTDFYNKKHANSLGAQKTTAYLSRYIDDHFDLEDKRGQEAYKSWDTAYETYTKFFNAGWAKKKNRKG